MAKKAIAKKKPGPPKGQGGRPPKLVVDEKVLRQVENMASLGLTQEQIALLLDIGERTFREHKERSEELSAAYKRGRSQGALQATSGLREQINNGNMTALIFYLKTQCRWKEPPHEISGPDGGPIENQHTLTVVGERIVRAFEKGNNEYLAIEEHADDE